MIWSKARPSKAAFISEALFPTFFIISRSYYYQKKEINKLLNKKVITESINESG